MAANVSSTWVLVLPTISDSLISTVTTVAGSSTGVSVITGGSTGSGEGGAMTGIIGSSTTSSVGGCNSTARDVAIRAIATAAPTPPKIQKFLPIFWGLSLSPRSRNGGVEGDFFSVFSSGSAGEGISANPASLSPRAIAEAARERASAEAGRPSGFFAMQDITRARTSSGIEVGSAGGASLICAMAIAT